MAAKSVESRKLADQYIKLINKRYTPVSTENGWFEANEVYSGDQTFTPSDGQELDRLDLNYHLFADLLSPQYQIFVEFRNRISELVKADIKSALSGYLDLHELLIDKGYRSKFPSKLYFGLDLPLSIAKQQLVKQHGLWPIIDYCAERPELYDRAIMFFGPDARKIKEYIDQDHNHSTFCHYLKQKFATFMFFATEYDFSKDRDFGGPGKLVGVSTSLDEAIGLFKPKTSRFVKQICFGVEFDQFNSNLTEWVSNYDIYYLDGSQEIDGYTPRVFKDCWRVYDRSLICNNPSDFGRDVYIKALFETGDKFRWEINGLYTSLEVARESENLHVSPDVVVIFHVHSPIPMRTINNIFGLHIVDFKSDTLNQQEFIGLLNREGYGTTNPNVNSSRFQPKNRNDSSGVSSCLAWN